jgi:hypothetical protein
MDFIKSEPDPGGQEFQSSAHSEHQVIDIKQDEEPVLINFQLMKTENEVSCMMCEPLTPIITYITLFLQLYKVTSTDSFMI